MISTRGIKAYPIQNLLCLIEETWRSTRISPRYFQVIQASDIIDHGKTTLEKVLPSEGAFYLRGLHGLSLPNFPFRE